MFIIPRRTSPLLLAMCLASCNLLSGCGPEVDRSELNHVVFEIPPVPLDAQPAEPADAGQDRN